jgi:DNA-binding SARP family transcriptional activator/TolB-like protein
VIRLTVFGQRDVVDGDSQPIGAVLRQPKAFAVFVYLVLAGPEAVRSRDSLLALFWPDSTEKHARHSLTQVLLNLRRDLGAELIVSRSRGEVGVRAGSVWCDAVEFDAARKHRDNARMLDLYTGELLPGFFVPRAAELEHWISEERERYRSEAATAAWALCESAEKGGEHRAAADWAAAATRISLNDETAIQRQLTLLGRLNDRTGAVHAYDLFRRRLAQELELEPSPETKRLIAEIRSLSGSPEQLVGDRLAVVATRSAATLSTAGVAPTDRAVTAAAGLPRQGQRPHRRRRLVLPATIGAALICAVAWGARNRIGATADPVAGAEISVAVKSFAPLDLASASVGRALTASTINQLALVRSFAVTGPDVANTRHTPAAPDRALRIRLLVAGNVARSQARIRVMLRIVDAVSGRIIRSAALDRDSGGQAATIEPLARQISSIVRTSAGHEIHLAMRSAQLHDKDAYALMQQADEDVDLASQFQRTGNFLDAVHSLESADALLAKVEMRDANWSEPMIERASIFERLGAMYMASPIRDTAVMRRLLTSGVAEANLAVKTDPRNPATMASLGSLDYWYWLAVRLPTDSAKRLLATAQRVLRAAVALDAGRPEPWSLLGASYQARADYSSAYVADSHAWSADTYLRNPQEILANLSTVAYEIRDDSAAQYWCDELNRQFEGSWLGAYCKLELLAEHRGAGTPASVMSNVWAIADDTSWSAAHGPGIESHFQLLAAAVLARYGMRDSAESVIARATAAGANDSELVPLEAYARLLLHEDSTATALMTQYVAVDPLGRTGVARSRRFASLPNLQRRLTLLGVPTATR